MPDCRTDEAWSARDRRHLENPKVLAKYYGGDIDKVMGAIRPTPFGIRALKGA